LQNLGIIFLFFLQRLKILKKTLNFQVHQQTHKYLFKNQKVHRGLALCVYGKGLNVIFGLIPARSEALALSRFPETSGFLAFAGMTAASAFDADLFDHPGSNSFPDQGEVFTLIRKEPAKIATYPFLISFVNKGLSILVR